MEWRWFGQLLRAGEGLNAAATKRNARRGRSRAGARREAGCLAFDLVEALAILPLGGLDRAAHLLAERAADEPAHAVGLPGGSFHDFDQRRAALPFQQGHHHGGLAALASTLAPGTGGFLRRLRGLLGRS